MTPAEFMIKLHQFDHVHHSLPLKKVMDAMDICFEENALFPPEVLKTTLDVLSTEKDLPLTILRTTMLAIKKYPILKKFVAYVVLIRLVKHEVWHISRLWNGFIMCVQMLSSETGPNAFLAVVQLPVEQFNIVLNKISQKIPSIRESIKKFAEKSEYKSSIKNEIFEELGLFHAVVEDGEL